VENWTDKNNKSLLCETERGVVRTFDLSVLVRKRSFFFEFIDDVIGRIIEGGIFMHIKKRGFEKAKLEAEFNSSTLDDTYSTIKTNHIEKAFYLLMLGYVFAVACFVTEIMWHRYRSKGR
jgi:hypothetical protein